MKWKIDKEAWDKKKKKLKRQYTKNQQRLILVDYERILEQFHKWQYRANSLFNENSHLPDLAKFIKENLQGKLPNEITLNEYFQKYIDRLSSNSNTTYISVLKKLNDFFSEEMLLLNVRIKDIQRFQEKLRDEVAYNTYVVYMSSIRTVFNYAYKEDVMPKKIFEKISVGVAQKSKSRKPLDISVIDQIEEFFHGFKEIQKNKQNLKHSAAAFLLEYYLGCRNFDITTLKWSSIDYEREKVGFYLQKVKAKTASGVIKEKWHEVPLHQKLLSILRKYEFRKKEGKIFVLPFMDKYKLDFIHKSFFKHDKELSKEEFEILYKSHSKICLTINRHLSCKHKKMTIAKAIGYKEKLTTHIARNSAAQRVWEVTNNMYHVKNVLNHSNVETSEGYTRGRIGEAAYYDKIFQAKISVKDEKILAEIGKLMEGLSDKSLVKRLL